MLSPHTATGARGERHRANQVYAPHHTPATGGEERIQVARREES